MQDRAETVSLKVMRTTEGLNKMESVKESISLCYNFISETITHSQAISIDNMGRREPTKSII